MHRIAALARPARRAAAAAQPAPQLVYHEDDLSPPAMLQPPAPSSAATAAHSTTTYATTTATGYRTTVPAVYSTPAVTATVPPFSVSVALDSPLAPPLEPSGLPLVDASLLVPHTFSPLSSLPSSSSSSSSSSTSSLPASTRPSSVDSCASSGSNYSPSVSSAEGTRPVLAHPWAALNLHPVEEPEPTLDLLPVEAAPGESAVAPPPASAPARPKRKRKPKVVPGRIPAYEDLIAEAIQALVPTPTAPGVAPKKMFQWIEDRYGGPPDVRQLPVHFRGSAVQALKKARRKGRVIVDPNEKRRYRLNPHYTPARALYGRTKAGGVLASKQKLRKDAIVDPVLTDASRPPPTRKRKARTKNGDGEDGGSPWKRVAVESRFVPTTTMTTLPSDAAALALPSLDQLGLDSWLPNLFDPMHAGDADAGASSGTIVTPPPPPPPPHLAAEQQQQHATAYVPTDEELAALMRTDDGTVPPPLPVANSQLPPLPPLATTLPPLPPAMHHHHQAWPSTAPAPLTFDAHQLAAMAAALAAVSTAPPTATPHVATIWPSELETAAAAAAAAAIPPTATNMAFAWPAGWIEDPVAKPEPASMPPHAAAAAAAAFAAMFPSAPPPQPQQTMSWAPFTPPADVAGARVAAALPMHLALSAPPAPTVAPAAAPTTPPADDAMDPLAELLRQASNAEPRPAVAAVGTVDPMDLWMQRPAAASGMTPRPASAWQLTVTSPPPPPPPIVCVPPACAGGGGSGSARGGVHGRRPTQAAR
ncbi:hypothetical protein GGF31_005067 [Allomyces arbusculus]|nr:hypothetical protein GGF31_005067 [Allomyces arbusculus]